MPIQDIFYTTTWWATLLSIGIIFAPITAIIFRKFLDKGYIFSKILGLAITSYIILLLGVLHIAVFSQITIFCVLVAVAAGEFWFILKRKKSSRQPLKKLFLNLTTALIVIEELLFFGSILFWTYIRTHAPDIHGLEKYMDYGFVNSILRSEYFPPKDMWLTPLAINYYYFGHFVTAVLTKLSALPSSITFNLMIATLFAFTAVAGFSIGGNLWTQTLLLLGKTKKLFLGFLIAGILSGFLLSSGGNLHTLYSFFLPYENEHPVPLWNLKFSPLTFPNAYWYPNATRYIYHTIHEFPSYSFVVSDLHGHVVDIPFVLLTLAIIFSLFLSSQEYKISTVKTNQQGYKKYTSSIPFFWHWVFISFLLAVMYMTNALDGLIYLLLAGVCAFFIYKSVFKKNFLGTIFQTPLITVFIILFGIFIIFSLPFSLFFKSFVSQIGLVCPPAFLIKLQAIGPFVFEPNHCEHSPWWQLLVLYGFFLFWFVSLGVVLLRTKRTIVDLFVFVIGGIAILLIIIPEFIYFRDIYTTYYRANTMFKFVYQAFMILMLVSTYTLARTFSLVYRTKNIFYIVGQSLFVLVGTTLVLLVGIYLYFAVGSYYDNLKTYSGIDGTTYLARQYPEDYKAINWINTHIPGQPVLLEAPGDSYTDYERISANTGLPTVIGWAVHEWLWRGTYDVVPPRQNDVQTLYETKDITTAKQLIRKYHIAYVYVGGLERQKYSNLSEGKFATLGQVVFHDGATTIYQLSF